MRGLLALAVVLAIGIAMPEEAFGATVTWDGDTDSNWATATNWVGDVAPVTGDDVVLTDAGNAYTNNDLVGVQLLSVTISSRPPGFVNIGGNPVELQSGGSITNSDPDGMSTSFNGGVTLNGPATFTISAGPSGGLEFRTNPITGTGPLTLVNDGGNGRLSLTAANTYSGATTVEGPFYVSLGSGAIPAGSALTVEGIARFLGSSTFGSLAGSGTVRGNGALTVGGDNASTTFSGVYEDDALASSLVKTGTGTLELSGANTYTGATTVSAGTLTVTGSTAAGTTITVESGATLDGTGTINGDVVLEDGATLGSGLTISGTLSVSDSSGDSLALTDSISTVRGLTGLSLDALTLSDSISASSSISSTTSDALAVSDSIATEYDAAPEPASSGGRGGGGGTTVIVNQGGSSVTVFPESHFADNPLDRIQVSSVAVLNAQGESVSQSGVGQQLIISGTFANTQETDQDYAFIVQITDEDSFVVFISWQQGTVGSGQTADASTSWTPTEEGTYTVQILVWDGVGAPPAPLSTVTLGDIEVTG